MSQPQNYSEEVKQKSRRLVFEHAISILTTRREYAPLVSRDYVSAIHQELQQDDRYRDIAAELDPKEIQRWEEYYSITLGKRRPSDLKVAILCGPEPQNDVRQLVDLGVRQENIWAFESKQANFSGACQQAIDSGFPRLKIFKCDITKFVLQSRQQFDFIYLDFCGTIASEISKVSSLLFQNCLSSTSVLATNFCLPSDPPHIKDKRHDLLSLASQYLIEKPLVEECETYGQYDVCEWNKRVFSDPSHYYGVFITRLLFDLALVFSPAERFAKFDEPLIEKEKLKSNAEGLVENRLVEDSETGKKDLRFADAVIEDKYAIVRTLRRLSLEKYKGELSKIFGKQFPKFASDFVRNLKGAEAGKDLEELTRKLFYLLSSHHREDGYKNFSQPMH